MAINRKSPMITQLENALTVDDLWKRSLKLQLSSGVVAHRPLADQSLHGLFDRVPIVGGIGTVYPKAGAVQLASAATSSGDRTPAIHTAQHRRRNLEIYAAEPAQGSAGGRDEWSLQSLLTLPFEIVAKFFRSCLPSTLLQTSPQTAALGSQSRGSEGVMLNHDSLLRGTLSLGARIYDEIGKKIPTTAADWTPSKTADRVVGLVKTAICFFLPTAWIGAISKLAAAAVVSSGIVAGSKALGYELNPSVVSVVNGVLKAGEDVLN